MRIQDINEKDFIDWVNQLDETTPMKWHKEKSQELAKIQKRLLKSRFICGRPIDEIQVLSEVAYKLALNYFCEQPEINNIIDETQKEVRILRNDKENLSKEIVKMLIKLIAYNHVLVIDRLIIDKYMKITENKLKRKVTK